MYIYWRMDTLELMYVCICTFSYLHIYLYVHINISSIFIQSSPDNSCGDDMITYICIFTTYMATEEFTYMATKEIYMYVCIHICIDDLIMDVYGWIVYLNVYEYCFFRYVYLNTYIYMYLYICMYIYSYVYWNLGSCWASHSVVSNPEKSLLPVENWYIYICCCR